ncbi:MAG: phytoene desaturase [Pseudomonadota bacterium]
MLTRASPPDSETLADKEQHHAPHAVVVGSGFGGLAAAVRLGARGYQVTVLEQNEQLGGRASVFRQDGFTFDAGPTIVTLPFLFEELWTLCGRRMEDDIDMRQLSPFYKLMFHDGSHFCASGDREEMRAEVARLSPGDVTGYDRFFEESRKIYGFAFERLGQMPFHRLWDLIKVIPEFIRYRADRSVYALASRFVQDPRIRIALSFHPLFIGGNPNRATGLYSLVSYLEHRYGVHFAMGGTGALVTGIAGLIEGQGGTLRCNSAVDEILVENGRASGVRLETGEVLPADIVVSNADSAFTYGNLLRNHSRRRWTDKKLSSSRYSMSLFVWYFGTDRLYEDVDHHCIVLGPRYRPLLKDIFDRKLLADDFSIYLHRPTKTDPSLAPPGCDTFYALSPVPHLDADIDWSSMAETYREKIAAELERRLLPGLTDHIVTSRLFTPIDFRDRLSSIKGAAFGLEPIITQSAWFRPHNRSEEVDGLYLVGAGTHPGAGLPGVISSARILDDIVPHGETVRA